MEELSVSVKRKDMTDDVRFNGLKITNAVDKGKRVKDCIMLSRLLDD
jgi:hypothetical protein